IAVGQDSFGGTDWRIIKYNAALTGILATTGYNDAVNGFDRAYGVAVNSLGEVIVVGTEAVAGGSWDWRINRYNAGLTAILSTTRYSGPGLNTDNATSVAIDTAGNIIVAGSEFGAVGFDNWSIRKY